MVTSGIFELSNECIRVFQFSTGSLFCKYIFLFTERLLSAAASPCDNAKHAMITFASMIIALHEITKNIAFPARTRTQYSTEVSVQFSLFLSESISRSYSLALSQNYAKQMRSDNLNVKPITLQ